MHGLRGWLVAGALGVACLAACATRAPIPDASSELHAEVAFSADGVPQGSYKLYDASGRLYATGEFVNGRREGLWTFWDPGGTKVVAITYHAGIKEGPCRMWFGSLAFPKLAGRLKLEVTFSKNRQEGLKRTWWASGELKCETELRRGAVRSAQCWDARGKPRPAAEAAKTARSDLADDTAYLQTLDEVVRASMPRTPGTRQ